MSKKPAKKVPYKPAKRPKQGRKDVSEKLKAALLEALTASLGVVQVACNAVGCSRALHYQYLEKDPEYARKVEELREVRVDFVEHALSKKISAGDITAIIFFLKTQAKHRGYIERVQTQEIKAEPFVIERTEAPAPDQNQPTAP